MIFLSLFVKSTINGDRLPLVARSSQLFSPYLRTVTSIQHIIIRKAEAADILILLQFEQGVIATERPFDPTLGKDPIHYYDLEGMIHDPKVELLVAQSGDQLVGSGYARIEIAKQYLEHRYHAYLGFMYVKPEYRGMGVNQKIIEALKNWAKEQGITELRLDVYERNLAAIRAYEKAGFSKHMVQMRRSVD